MKISFWITPFLFGSTFSWKQLWRKTSAGYFYFIYVSGGLEFTGYRNLIISWYGSILLFSQM